MELPIYVAESVKDLAEKLGHAVGTICSYLSRGTVSKYKDYRFIKLDIEKGIAMALLKHVGMSRGDMARLIKSVDNQNIKENR